MAYLMRQVPRQVLEAAVLVMGALRTGGLGTERSRLVKGLLGDPLPPTQDCPVLSPDQWDNSSSQNLAKPSGREVSLPGGGGRPDRSTGSPRLRASKMASKL